MSTGKAAGLTSSSRFRSMRPGMNRAKDEFSVPRTAPRAGGKSAAKDTLIRQWEILRRMPAHGCGITVSELAERLRDECDISVTRRTVERDLEMLSGIFPLDCNNISKPYGWRWMEKGSIGLPGLDLCDALSLLVARDALRQMLPATMLEALEHKFSEAEGKLRASSVSRLETWPEKVRYVPPALACLPPKIAPEVLKTVQTALITDRQVALSYDSPYSGANDLTLHPLALVHRGPVIYLAATAFDYSDVRLYAMHRIAKAAASDQPANRPKGFSIDKYLADGAMDFSPSEPIQLKARISETLAHYLRESPLNDSQKIGRNKRGQTVLNVQIRDSWQLRWWILSQGTGFVVLEPRGLREEIAGAVQSTHNEYNP
jgi:predicted DNA-binding transcriptional regulator YafY